MRRPAVATTSWWGSRTWYCRPISRRNRGSMRSTTLPTCWRAWPRRSHREIRDREIRAVNRLAVALAAWEVAAGPARAQPDAAEPGWPSRPIRLIVPFPPASTADVVARVLGQKLGLRLGQQFVVENRVGASGNIGAEMIAKAAPDGYTVGIVTSSTQAVAATLSSRLPYHPIRDFTPIVMIASSPYVLVVYPGLPAQSLAELIALAKRKPGALNYGSAGAAGPRLPAPAAFASLTDTPVSL